MRVHYLQHVPFEGLGSIEPWLSAHGHFITRTCLYLEEPLPHDDRFDWLIVMGGPMGANDDEELAWLSAEKSLIRRAIDGRKRVLGICLGAQLIAAALGAKVFKNAHREIGWFPIERAAEAGEHPLGAALPDRAEVFHWHGDTFDLPKGAVALASSQACRNQAFAVGNHVLALQFHLETTAAVAGELIEHCRGELTAGPYVQTPEQMLARPERFSWLNASMARLLEAWTAAGEPIVARS